MKGRSSRTLSTTVAGAPSVPFALRVTPHGDRASPGRARSHTPKPPYRQAPSDPLLGEGAKQHLSEQLAGRMPRRSTVFGPSGDPGRAGLQQLGQRRRVGALIGPLLAALCIGWAIAFCRPARLFPRSRRAHARAPGQTRTSHIRRQPRRSGTAPASRRRAPGSATHNRRRARAAAGAASAPPTPCRRGPRATTGKLQCASGAPISRRVT